MISKPEILIPGGDFNSAIHGLSNGADAVYTGLKSFSARKGAKNLTLEELRRLKSFAQENNKKIYIAINTLIEDKEIPQVLEILQELERIKVDAVIIQDLGLAKIIKENFNLEIHASTQLAVHNIHGVKALKRIGFSRVVLSRELNLDEIKNIKSTIPDMELEVFIHGALCYGFSGLCLASGKLLGRSANRGECGQICRTWFNNGEKREYNFSLNDLHLGKNILKLKEIGVESLKIEGRMKGPSYTSKVANYYKSILTGKNRDVESPLVEFNRSGGTGYLFNKTGGTTLNKNYPGHTGLLTGSLVSTNKTSFTINSREKLSNHDGIMLLPNSINKKPFKIGVKILKKDGNRYTLSGNIPKGYLKDVYKISNHNKSLKEYKPESYKIFKSIIPIRAQIKSDKINIYSDYFNFSYDYRAEKANKESRYREELERILSPGGDSYYSFKLESIESEIENPFLPSSIVKKVRNNFLEEFIQSVKDRDREKIEKILSFNYYIEERSYKAVEGDIPFFPYSRDGERITLKPVEFDSESYLKELEKETGKSNLIIGLNNISQIEFARKLPDMDYYCDYGLYCNNRWAKALINELVPNLKWITKWVERDSITINPPIFISRTCFHRVENGCPKNCKKQYSYTISQNNKEYRVLVRDCLTYTFV